LIGTEDRRESAIVDAELEAVRLDRANLLAAIRACLAADAEGEPDALSYLRAELDAPDTRASATRRRA